MIAGVIGSSVAGCSPYLIKYARDRSKGRISALESQNYERALLELEDFMNVDGLGFVCCC